MRIETAMEVLKRAQSELSELEAALGGGPRQRQVALAQLGDYERDWGQHGRQRASQRAYAASKGEAVPAGAPDGPGEAA